MARRPVGALAVLCLGLVGCTPGGTAPAPASAAGSSAVPTGTEPTVAGPAATVAACDSQRVEPMQPFDVPATGGTVTGLAFGALPARVGDELKIVWRVTGEGDLSVRPVRPDGTDGELVLGPEPHGGSNFSAPGDEWGTGLLLDRPGCWQLELAREGVAATVPLLVEETAG